MAMHQGNIIAALALASAGIKIFPAGADKRPLLKGWQDAATCDADQINTWFEHAAARPAIPCGSNNLVVIDCDRHPGGADGVAAFNSLVAANGALPPQMPLVKTPNGGLHAYFRQPNGEALGNVRGSLPPGIDVRGAGGFVIAPGANLPDGRGWTAVPERAAIKDAPPLPQWLAAILRPPLGLRQGGGSNITDCGHAGSPLYQVLSFCDCACRSDMLQEHSNEHVARVKHTGYLGAGAAMSA
jgi:hypothetical protein